MPSTIPFFNPLLIFIHSRFIFILKWLIRIIKMIRAGDGVEVGMAGRDVNCSRQHCDYGCGSWHVCTHAVIFPFLCLPPLFVFVCTHCHSSVLLPTIIDPCPYVPLSVKVCVHVPAHLSTLGCTGWPSLAPPAPDSYPSAVANRKQTQCWIRYRD